MANTKLIIGLALVAGAAYMLTRKKKNTDGKTEILPVPATDNRTQRWLTDAEALSYLNNNPDLIAHYGAGNIEGAKQHFHIIGYTENRTM